jgi:iron complex outermembrane receptor protein
MGAADNDNPKTSWGVLLMNRKLLASAICASLLVAGTAYAQDNPAPQAQTQQPATLQTITVTGSHIREAQLATAQPVIAITHDDIQKQGFTSVADILQNLTVTGSPAISRADVLASGEAVGGYYVDIHNIGASRTLVLLNGHRLGTTTGGLADLQQIPIAAIERIDVLKDGASAVYGSDAIGGVVNIITRDNFTGAEVSGYVGQYDENSDGQKQTYSMTIGARGDKGSVMLSAEYAKEDPVWARDRWFSATPKGPYHPNAGWTVVGKQGVFFNYNPTTYALYGMCDYYFCTPNPGGDYTKIGPDGDYHPSDFTSGSPDTTNTNEKYMYNSGTERKTLFVSGSWDFNDHVHFQSNILYNDRTTYVEDAGYPFQPAFTLPGSSTIIGLSPDSYFNPLGNGPNGNGEKPDSNLLFYRRGWEVSRSEHDSLTTYRFGGAFSGDFNIGDHNWNWDIGGYTNENRYLRRSRGNFNLVATAEALGPSYLNTTTGRVECGTATDPIPYGATPGSCVPWNPLIQADYTGPGSLTGNPDLQTFLFPIFADTGTTKTTDYTANLTGSIVTLPAGDLAVALGVEYRKEEGKYIPGPFRQSALNTDLSVGPTGGQYDVKSEYLEVSVPLLADMPFFQSLSLDAAVRHEKYSSFGSTTNDKISLTWRPIQDLMIAGTIAHGFRAPQISDLYGGLSGDFAFYTDPCDITQQAGSNPEVEARCSGGIGDQAGIANAASFRQLGQGGQLCGSYPCQTGTQFFSGSNPNLQPEKALNRNAQIVYSPSWIPASWGKLDITADYFDIIITNAISGDSIGSVLNDCYVLGVVSRCSSSLFTRGPNGVIDYALTGEKNAGMIRVKGEDLGIRYQLPQTSFGLFTFNFQGTYYDLQNQKPDNLPDTPLNHSNSWGSAFRYRVNASLDWSLGNWGATWTTRLYSAIKEQCSYDNTSEGGPECNTPGHYENGVVSNINITGDTAFNDLQVRYTIAPIQATVSLGVNNVFDRFGPILYSAPSSSIAPYYGGFDIGRFYYVRYNQKF